MGFKAVIFDWDGTLADSKKVIVESFQKALSDIGCVVDDDFLERRIGIGTRLMIIDSLKENKIEYTDQFIEQLIGRKLEHQVNISKNVSLFDGVVELLEALQGRIRIALATMSNREVIDKLLDEKGLTKYFEVVISADDVKNPKPNPEVFLTCAKKLNIDPKDCVVVEDSLFGVEAAKKAGMKCIAIPSGAYTEEELSAKRPDLLVNSITERKQMLRFLF